MRVTQFTRDVLAGKRLERERVLAKGDLLALGWEEIGEGGGKLWELYRGGRYDHKIVDVLIAPGGKSLFVKIEKAGVAR